MEVLTGRLSRPEAFGPVSAWGPEVFIEIGTLAGTIVHYVPEDANCFCGQKCVNCFMEKEAGRGEEMTAGRWIAAIKNIPEASKSSVKL